MNRKTLLYTGFSLAALLWLLNYVAIQFYFYWTLDWYDYLMHFLGGLVLGVLTIWLFKIEERSLKSFLIVFVSVMLVSAGWEVFEYMHDIAVAGEKYWPDTIKDFLMDAVGMLVAYKATLQSRQ